MLLASCPNCAMPRSEADIADRPCPLCGYVAGQAVTPYVDEPPPPVVETPVTAVPVPPPVNRKAMIAPLLAAALCAAILGFVIGQQYKRPVVVGERLVEVRSTVAVEVPAAARPTKADAAPTEPTPAPTPETPPAVPPPTAAQQLPGGVSLIRLDRPAETYTLERLGEGNHVKIVGSCQKLTLHGADGSATLDASELDTKIVSVTGPVEGKAHLRLHATDGTVTFSKPVSGGARIEVDAPNCLVTFSSGYTPTAEGAPVSGGVKIRVNSKSVAFGKKIDGGCTVETTLANGGSLKFLELAGGSKLHYKFEKPDDVVKILPGQIDESSECRKLE